MLTTSPPLPQPLPPRRAKVSLSLWYATITIPGEMLSKEKKGVFYRKLSIDWFFFKIQIFQSQRNISEVKQEKIKSAAAATPILFSANFHQKKDFNKKLVSFAQFKFLEPIFANVWKKGSYSLSLHSRIMIKILALLAVLLSRELNPKQCLS